MKTIRVLFIIMATAGIVAGAQAQPTGGRGRQGGAVSGLTSTPLAKDDAEKKILSELEAMDPGPMSVTRDDGRFLRMLAESIGAKHVVELGTCHGYSAVWLCLALRTTDGKLTTYEIDGQRAQTARENFKRAGVSSIVTLVEGDAHKEVTKLKEPIDMIFLDADKEGYADYLAKLLPLVRPGGLILAHNINAQRANPAFIKAITTNPILDSVFLNLGNQGFSASVKKR